MAPSKSNNNYNGIFTPIAGTAAGHLIVDGRASRLKLVKTGHLETDRIEFRDLHGILASGKYASALGCIRINATESYSTSRPHSETTYFPHFVAIGESHFAADDKIITAIHFSFENAHCLVNGHRTFHAIHPSPEQARRILEDDHKRIEEIARKRKWGDNPFDPEISEHPHLLYFSGKWLDTAFYRNSYDVDRIVGAANMFDLLPADRAPKAKDVDPATQGAIERCRAIVKALPLGHARQSLLSAFGRLGAASLRDKVVHRAKLLQATSDRRFPELEMPCTQAVICRNHFVHGSDSAFDYVNNFHAVAFLSDTLEYVFAMTDLIDLGWSFADWQKQGTTGSHPFGLYASDYQRHLDNLKDVLRGSPMAPA
jgi:hypothetical protein